MGSWQSAPAWRVNFIDEQITLAVHRPDGLPALALAPYDVPPEHRERGLFKTLRTGLSQGFDAAVWIDRRGRLREGSPPVRFTTADGSPAELWNGREKGWRRKHRNGRISIDGRTYEVRHRSRRRTSLVVDGVARATLRRKGFGWGRFGDDKPRYVVRSDGGALDHWDELAIVLTGSALGPVGRPGFWANFSGDLSP